METRFGYPLDTWQAIKQEARHILIECAKSRQTITYGELAGRITVVHFPHYGFKMVGLLDEISTDEFAEGRSPLAALVVRRSNGLPGGGFFRKTFPPDAPEDDLRAYWEAEFNRTCADWVDYSDI